MAVLAQNNDEDQEIRKAFSKFNSQYKRQFRSAKEQVVRFDNFKKTYEEVQRHNAEAAETAGYTMGLNQFSDKSIEEIKKESMGAFEPSEYIPNYKGINQRSALPDNFGRVRVIKISAI
jgi:hypothetical protein